MNNLEGKDLVALRESSRTDRDDTNRITGSIRLFEASKEGSVATLNALIKNDPLILTRISLTTSTESPLHISAALNHLDFTVELLKLKPQLASELDSLRRSPLHLAAAEGHVEIARALLRANKDVCFVKDQHGRIPLHYAAMRGRVDVIQLLVDAQSESVFEVLPSGETALHLCVRHNHLEALRLLVEASGRDTDNAMFLNAKEHETGNTVLHLAVTLGQSETVEYLLSINGVEKDSVNNERDERDVKLPKKSFKSRWFHPILKRLKSKRLKDVEGSIMVVATLIVSMTFQATINPPGGVWQQTYNTTNGVGNHFDCQNRTCLAGTSVLAHMDYDSSDYLLFLWLNSMAFLTSVSILLLIMVGVPIKNKVCIGLFNLVLCVTLAFVGFSYFLAMTMVNPAHINKTVLSLFVFVLVWCGIFLLWGAWFTIRLVLRMPKCLRDGKNFISRKWQA
ncbi:ankyrin repeat-containing protein BDA1-like [Humulus lupulus]|uniref:ankyrin repeat-containing protein BDA1-like n=1 Tax=Humulus lupulus TaxID=3486 RepID=UPI002B415107|nr:ankyrin repeat-containing protein BDA1-like [Humulus lupulus]XP_062115457.1 ankyrin repeat-containing protein BDA1-like [Humulus lupulus]